MSPGDGADHKAPPEQITRRGKGQVWAGGNITDHFVDVGGDRNKHGEGLFEDPPGE